MIGIGIGIGIGKRGRFSAPIPIVQSAAIAQATPTKVAITFDIALDETSVPTTTDFTLAGKTISLVEISAAVVTLTVSVSYSYGDSVTVSYTAGANKLKGTAGGIVDSFSGQVVTNNITHPLVINDGNTVAWFDAQLLSTITKDAGTNEVSRWNDKLLSGHDLLQSTATKLPIWSSDGITFDGSNDFMKCSTFTWNQPEFIYIVANLKTWVIARFWFDGNGFVSGCLGQNNVNKIQPYAGTYLSEQTISPNTTVIVRVLFNGANSKWTLNNNSYTTGNAGASNMSGFTLGALSVGDAGYCCNLQAKEIILRKIADSVADDTAIYNYLKAKYGL